MIVVVSLPAAGPLAAVQDVEVLDRLHVSAPGLDRAGADQALRATGTGRMTGPQDSLLDIASLARVGGAVAADPGWAARFAHMIDYARTRGWVTDDGAHVRAHVEDLAD